MVTAERYLTKVCFKSVMECPIKLLYTKKKNLYRNVKGWNDFLESFAEGGFQVEKIDDH